MKAPLWRRDSRRRPPHVSLRTPQIRFDIAQAVAIKDHSALEALEPGIKRCISDEFSAESLAARLCPVLMTDHSVAIFALSEYAGSDQADELVRRAVAKGYRLAHPERFILDAPLLLAVARNDIVHGQAAGHKARTHSRTALTDAFQDLIEWGVRHNASDLHLNVFADQLQSEVKYTIRGRYVAPDRFRHMSTQMLTDMLAVVWMDVRGGNGALFDPRAEQQGSLVRVVDGSDVIIRWASLAADTGPSVCLRLLVRHMDIRVADLASLGYMSDQIATIERVMLSEGGAIIFAGTVGSGKSTTLATLISSLPEDRKIITIEDPVEYRIPNAIQNTVARSLVEEQPQAYAAKLRTLKRSAMTDVLLGEIRDRETGQAFMDLAGSGVNVYTTVHAPSAASVPDRLASDFIGVSRDFLSTPGAIRLIVFQSLVACLCQHCSLPASSLLDGGWAADGRTRPGAYWALWLEQIQNLYATDVTTMRVRNPLGCARCQAHGIRDLKGYAGRTVVAESIEPALQHGYLDSVRRHDVGGWLDQQAPDATAANELARSPWRCAMDTAVMKALDGQIDPRDIERHFQSFDTRVQQVQARQSGPVSVSSNGRQK